MVGLLYEDNNSVVSSSTISMAWPSGLTIKPPEPSALGVRMREMIDRF